MNLTEEIQTVLSPLGIPVETGVYKGKAPDCYMVAVPMTDSFEMNADDSPGYDVQSIRLSLFKKGNYMTTKKSVLSALLSAGLYITNHRYIGFETDTGYHHYSIDVENLYEFEMGE